jgi:hypothetical protein
MMTAAERRRLWCQWIDALEDHQQLVNNPPRWTARNRLCASDYESHNQDVIVSLDGLMRVWRAYLAACGKEMENG